MAKKEDSKNIKEESKKEVQPEVAEKETKAVDEVKDTKEKNNGLIIKIVVAAVVLVLLLIGGKFLFDNFKNDDSVSGVRRVLKAKYADISCMDSGCNGFIVIDGDKHSKYKVMLYNVDGEKVANYKVTYDSEDTTSEVPTQIWGKQYISTTVNISKFDVLKYSIRNKRGKVVFETKNKLRVLNDKFVLMTDKEADKNKYSLLDKKGKSVYSGISDVETYLDGEYIVIEMNDTYAILNSKGEKILDGYKIAKIVEDEDDEPLFAIIKNDKDSVYNYYDLDKQQIVGDSFVNYDLLDKEKMTYEIVKKENDKRVNYILYKNGKQEKNEEDLDATIDTIKESLNKDEYTLYNNSVYENDQKEVLVDNKKDKSFGVLNIKDKKYTKVYDYKKDRNYVSSTVSKLDSENGSYLKISCSKYNCEEAQSIVYNLEDKKVMYSSKGTLSISSYVGYEDGYKVVKFNGLSSDEYDDKSVVFDKDNKELYKSDDNVIIVDKEVEFGKKSSYSLMLYSVKKDKALNSEKVSSTTVAEKTLYKYTDDNDNTVILNDKGEEILKAKDDNYLKQSGDSYIYLDDNLITIYNVDKDKTYEYKLKENEKMNDGSGTMITPYRNSMFINNSTDKYIKVINFKGKTLKKIKKVEITDVEINISEKKAFIIVKKNSKKGDQYGLYVAE